MTITEIKKRERNIFTNNEGEVLIVSPKRGRTFKYTSDQICWLVNKCGAYGFHVDHADDYNGSVQVSAAAYIGPNKETHVYVNHLLRSYKAK